MLAQTAFACAPVAKTGMQSISTEQQSFVNAMCLKVMGLWTGEAYFRPCQENLANLLAAKAQRDATVIAYRECAQRGPEEGSADFSVCMLNSERKTTAPEPMTVTDADTPGIEAGKSFDDVSSETRMNRERYVCAQIGLLPESGPFDDCVSSLKEAFAPSLYPPFENLRS
jgi:hypothetical protein